MENKVIGFRTKGMEAAPAQVSSPIINESPRSRHCTITFEIEDLEVVSYSVESWMNRLIEMAKKALTENEEPKSSMSHNEIDDVFGYIKSIEQTARIQSEIIEKLIYEK